MKKIGVLKGIYPKLHLEKMGYDLTAFIQLSIDSKKGFALAEHLKNNPQITGIFEVSGPYNLMIVAKYRSTQEMHGLVKELAQDETVQDIVTSVAYSILKESHAPFPLTSKKEE